MNKPQLLGKESRNLRRIWMGNWEGGGGEQGAGCGWEVPQQDLGLKAIGRGRDAQGIPGRADGWTPLCPLTTGLPCLKFMGNWRKKDKWGRDRTRIH